MAACYQIFQGKETTQVAGHLARPAQPEAWYYEPADYAGDLLWSLPYRIRDEAEHAAQEEATDAAAHEEKAGEASET